MGELTISEYIKSKQELKLMPFMTVYKTIMVLIDDGFINNENLKRDDSDVQAV